LPALNATGMFTKLFLQTLSGYTDSVAAQLLCREVEKRMSERHRYYHTMDHLDFIAVKISGVKDEIEHWDLLVFAIAYHDIVYDVKKSDNEEKSAGFAARALHNILEEEQIDVVQKFIIATKSHKVSGSSDENYFTDADLAILGASEQDYKNYARAIRKEYSLYPDILYKGGRKKVLQYFLNMPSIFKTRHFRELYEQQARINLDSELHEL
jgi:predicted metal-dependent HD superfamily phosphohydrolase